jgi:two-component system, NarL family, nitrate/nitrite response regulator NarL
LSNDIVRTAIASGDSLLREGLRRILEDTRYRVDIMAPSIGEVLAFPDDLGLILLLSFSDADPQFLDAVAELPHKWPKVRVVAIAAGRAEQLVAALAAGVHGYLPWRISSEALLRFLTLIMLGQRVFSTAYLDLPKELDGSISHSGGAAHGSEACRVEPDLLTPRERELLVFLLEGHSNKVIARSLGIAEATVKAQMVRLFVKIGAANRTQAAVLAWALHRVPFEFSTSLVRTDIDRVS